jgi:hypothetical protein
MANMPLDDRSAGDRYVNTTTRTVASAIGRKTTLVGDLLRHAWPRWRKDLAEKHAAISSQRREPGHAAEASRSPMEAGITRGSSLLFDPFGSKR